MRRLPVALLLVVGASLACMGGGTGTPAGQESYPKLDEKYGFRDLTFEQPCLSSWRRLEDFDGATQYERPRDEMKIGDVALESIRYLCADGKLAEVSVRFKGRDIVAVAATMEAAYGTPSKTPMVDYYTWESEKVRASIIGRGSRGLMSIKSKAMQPAMDDAKKRAVDQAAKDL